MKEDENMKKDKYVYPAIFEYAEDGISIYFPDLEGVYSSADNEAEALIMAAEALELHLFGMETEGLEIPEASSLRAIKTDHNSTAQLISVYMPIIREYMNNQSVKKTLTIPMWMDTQIKEKEKKVNLSGILQDSLIKLFGLQKPLNSDNSK